MEERRGERRGGEKGQRLLFKVTDAADAVLEEEKQMGDERRTRRRVKKGCVEEEVKEVLGTACGEKENGK